MTAFGSGGFDYSIELRDGYTQGLQDFRQRVNEAKQEARELRAEVDRLRRAARRVRLPNGAAASGGGGPRAAAAGGQGNEAAARAETRGLSRRERALKQYNDELERQAVAEERARVASERAFRAERRRETNLESQSRGIRQETREINNKAAAEQRATEATRNGLRAQSQQASATRTNVDAQRNLTRAYDRTAEARQRAALADREGLRVERQLTSESERRVQAARALTEAQNRSQRDNDLVREAGERGVTRQQLVDLGLLRNSLTAQEEAALRAARAMRQVAVAREEASEAARTGFSAARRLRTEEELQADAASRVTRVLNQKAQAEANANEARRRGLSDSEAVAAGLREETAAARGARLGLQDYERQLERLARAETRSQRAAEDGFALQRRRISDLDALAQGHAEITRRINERIRREQLAVAIRERGLSGEDVGNLGFTANDLTGTQTAAQRTARELRAVDNQITRIIKRTLILAAAYTTIREVATITRESIRSVLEYNAALEIAQLSISALIASAADVRNVFGASAGAAESLSIATRESRRQVNLLRRDALNTAASFEELVENFQTAVGPGLAAGLNLDEIRDLTVRISQAAAAIGLPQNQLSEEIRSLLAGTIQPRQTRIATVLNITNEDIRRAKEAGDLVGFLEERFEAFGVAGEAALGTFDVLRSNTFDALLQVGGQGSIGFFNELKGLFEDIQGTLASAEIDNVELNPAAVALVEELSDGLKTSVELARDLLTEISGEEIAGIAATIRSSFNGAATVIASATAGAVRAASDLSTVLNVLTAAVSSSEEGEGQINDTVAAFSRIALNIGAVALGARVASRAFGIIGLRTSRLRAPLRSIARLSGLFGRDMARSAEQAGSLRRRFQQLGRALLPVRAILLAKVGLVGAIAAAALGIIQSVLNILPGSLQVADAFQLARDAVVDLANSISGPLSRAMDTITRQARDFAAFLGFDNSLAASVNQISEAFVEGQGAILSASQSASAYSDAIKQTTEEAERLTRELEKQSRIRTQGQSPRNRSAAFTDGEFEADDLNNAVALELANNELLLTGVRNQQRLLDDRIASLGEEGEAVDRIIRQQEQLGRAQALLNRDSGNAALAQQVQELAAATDAAIPGLAEAEAQLAALREQGGATERILALVDAARDRIGQAITGNPDFRGAASSPLAGDIRDAQGVVDALRARQAELLELARRRVELSGQEAGLVQVIAERQRDLGEVTVRAAANVARAQQARIQANDEALSLELSAAEERARLLREQAALPANADPRLRQIADLRLALADLRAQQRAAFVEERREILELESQRADSLRAIARSQAEAIERVAQARGVDSPIPEDFELRLQGLDANDLRDLTRGQDDQLDRQRAALRQEDPRAADVLGEDLAPSEEARTALINFTFELERLLEIRERLGEAAPVELDLQIEEIEARLNQISAPRTISFEIRESLDQLVLDAGTAAQAVADTFTSAIDGASSLIGSTLRDALDPRSDSSFRERLGEFLLDLVEQFVAAFAKIAIARAAALAFSGGDDAPDGNSTTTTSQGPGDGASAAAAGAGLIARILGAFAGFGSAAGGGEVASPTIVGRGGPAPLPSAPSGMDSRDRFPVFARKGEYIVQPESWMPLGRDFMDRLNAGQIRPQDIASFSSVSGRERTRRGRLSGFAQGGVVGDGPSTFATPQSSPRASRQGNAGGQFIVVPERRINEQNAYEESEGGLQGILRHMRQHRGVYRTTLGV